MASDHNITCIACGEALEIRRRKPWERERVPFELQDWMYLPHDCPEVPLDSECWIWRFGRSPAGYATIYAKGGRRLVNRVTMGVLGLPSSTHSVTHDCDNPPCVRPSHLRVASHAENMAGMVDRKRSKRGNRNPVRVLSEADIPPIRRQLAAGESLRSVARQYGVHMGTIISIKYGKSWVGF